MNDWPVDAFEQFWKLYPKKRNKGDARRAMEKLRKSGLHFDLIMRGLNEFIRWKPYRDIQYCPYPASWLNSEAWDNEYDAPREDTLWKLDRAMRDTLIRRVQ